MADLFFALKEIHGMEIITLLGTNISHPKAVGEDEFPFAPNWDMLCDRSLEGPKSICVIQCGVRQVDLIPWDHPGWSSRLALLAVACRCGCGPLARSLHVVKSKLPNGPWPPRWGEV